MLAQQKIEQLRTLPLDASPPDALERNSAGYFDFVGAAGQELDPEGGEAAAPSGSAYIRRWAVDPLPADPAGSRVLRVAVLPGSGGAPVTLVTVARREGL